MSNPIDPTEQAKAFFFEGNALFEADRLDEALSRYQAALALVAQRQSELDAAQRRLARSQTLVREGASSEQEVDDDRARVRSQQGRFPPRVGQGHIDDVHREQVGLARIEAALEDLQVGDLGGLDAQRGGGQPRQGLDGMRGRQPVEFGLGRGVGGAAVFGWHGVQRQLEFGESDHGVVGACVDQAEDRARVLSSMRGKLGAALF